MVRTRGFFFFVSACSWVRYIFMIIARAAVSSEKFGEKFTEETRARWRAAAVGEKRQPLLHLECAIFMDASR